MEASINFFSEKIRFVLTKKTIVRSWLNKCAAKEKKQIGELNYIFCSDPYIKKINKQYLNHNYFTDIITFPASSPSSNIISGDIFISIDTVRDNAKTFNVTFSEELNRVMVHGLLHLCGYADKSEKDQKVMRKKEDTCLGFLK